jgi:hypothetical protein
VEKPTLVRRVLRWVGFLARTSNLLHNHPRFASERIGARTSLNARGILTRRGGVWHKSTVMNLLAGWGSGRRHASVPADVAAGANLVVGYGIAVLTQVAVFP